MTEPSKYNLPLKLEPLLAILCKHFISKERHILTKIIVNSKFKVKERDDYVQDENDLVSVGHGVIFFVPASLYTEALDEIENFRSEVLTGLNKVNDVAFEYVSSVSFIVQEDLSLQNWREKSGLLIPNTPLDTAKTEDELKELWDTNYFRIFLSHKAEFKEETKEIKRAFLYYGLSCFVAHEDIEPTREWEKMIEMALFSMDAMVVLMTEKFHESYWTDQEIGVAIGRRVPIVSIRLGRDPYGFIGKFQGVAGIGKDSKILAKEILMLLLANPNSKNQVVESLVLRFEKAGGFVQANELIKILDKVEILSPEQLSRLEEAPEINENVHRAWTVPNFLPGILKKFRGENS